MVKILDADIDSLKEIRPFFPLLASWYPDGNFVLYVVSISLDEKAYVFRQQEHCMFYVPSKEQGIPFDVDENGHLTTIYYQGYEIDYEFSSIKKDNKEYSLSIEEKDYDDEYNGEVSFIQKNYETGEICSIFYDHMYYHVEHSPIYPNHTKEKTSVIHMRREKYDIYERKIIEQGSPIYSYVCANSGIKNRQEDIVRFYKEYSLFGHKFTLPLLETGASVEEMDAFLLSRGFLTEIPSLLFDVYNENNSFLKMLSEIVLLIKEINDKKDDTKRLLISLKE